ncbi:zf-HC2 domain-containing protein [Niallia sp. 03133]|uniref:zf-HC2 domain-containing protein n=1 Tax=Niallia sp. 03133 TaxID=3458060 RepID=UPI00404486F5
MELNHDVVKDLYPLYMENDISPTVKKAVEDHLQKCEECRKSYENGDGFYDLKELADKDNPSSSLDDKLILKIKLTRFKWITVFLIGVILTMVLTDYKNDREKLFQAIQTFYGTERTLPSMFETIKNKEYSDLENIQELIHQLSAAREELGESFNFIEKHKLKNTDYSLYLNTSRFNAMLEIMQYRFDQGMWSKTDEKAFGIILQEFNELDQLAAKEYQKMHHGYSSYLETFNVEKMDVFYKKINLLSDSYTRFHKLPEEVKPLKEAELKQKIADILKIPNKKIKLEKMSPLNENPYTYQMTISGNYSGTIDGINGQILKLYSSSNLTDEPVMNKVSADKQAARWMEKIYGKDIKFELVSLGFNYNVNSNDPKFKVYSYEAVPVVNGNKFYAPFDQNILLHIDARTGKLDTFYHFHHAPNFDEFKKTDTSIKVDKDFLRDKNLTETVIIYSAITGKYELVYMNPSLEDLEEGKFFSSRTLKEERIYNNEQ